MKNHTIEQSLALAGIGRTRLYQEIKEGRLKVLKCGRRTLIPEQSLIEWQSQLLAATDTQRAEKAAG